MNNPTSTYWKEKNYYKGLKVGFWTGLSISTLAFIAFLLTLIEKLQ